MWRIAKRAVSFIRQSFKRRFVLCMSSVVLCIDTALRAPVPSLSQQEKDLEATADIAPKKLGGKKSRVAPGSGEGDDDSDLGLEDMLLADEEAKGDASKKIKQKPAASKGKSAVQRGALFRGLPVPASRSGEVGDCGLILRGPTCLI
jgi:hypothetical protein